MRALLHVTFVAAALAGGFLLACGEDTGVDSPPTTPQEDAAPESAAPDVVNDVVDAALPDARPPFDGAAPDIECAVTPCITRLVAGPMHYCAVDSDGVVRCWGEPNALGSFVPTSTPSAARGATPVVLEGIGDVVDIGASSSATCVAHADGGIDCFGSSSPTPSAAASVSGVKTLAVGDPRSCAIGANDELWCWGDSFILGSAAGALTLGEEEAVSVAMSTYAGFAIGSNGSLFSWGGVGYARLMLGRDTSADVDLTPDHVVDLPAALQVASSDQHVCAVTADGRLFCWGDGNDGVLGIGTFQDTPRPTEVPLPQPEYPAQVAVSHTHTCVRMTDGTLDCWARSNTFGQLGYQDVEGVFVPRRVALEKSVAAVAVGTNSTCVLSTDGSVQCWGTNARGQLGLGARDSKRHYVPTDVVFP